MDIIKNWKLLEVVDRIEIIHVNSIQFRDFILRQQNIPIQENVSGLNREETTINWHEVKCHHKFFFDNPMDEDFIRTRLSNSELRNYKFVTIIYGYGEPAVKVLVVDFIDDWEGFVRSTQWETIIFTDDFKLIMEISRDYFMHSNFKIA